MSTREPLHQAPNPDDLRRQPPRSSECAVVRGMLRDFADQDLEPAEAQSVEDHVHACRTCAVELARAEHETMRLRQAYASLRADQPKLPNGFAARVVERLVLDETSMVRPDALAAAADAAQAAHAAARAERLPRASRVASPLGLLFFASLVLAVLVGGLAMFDAGHGEPGQVARLVVLEAHGLADADGNGLGTPNGLGDHQALRIGHGGDARMDWHDLSTRMQPAASLAMYGAGEVRMVDGRPLLVNGNVEVITNRAVSIPIADGSVLDLGVGEYLVAAEALDQVAASASPSDQALLAGAPADLFVKVEVRRGDAATVVRTVGSATVRAGQVGVYQGSSTLVPTNIGGGDIGLGDLARTVAPPVAGPAASSALTLSGVVLDPMGQPMTGAEVRLSFGVGAGVQNLSKISGGDGAFVVPVDRGFDADFAVALAFAGGSRSDLGMVAPDAWPIGRIGQNLHLQMPVALGFSVPLTGRVVDDLGVARAGVTVLPCIVDELFGHVMALHQFRTSTEPNGSYRIERLPSVLPPHQGLMVLLLHGALEPTVVPVPQRGCVVATEWMEAAVMPRLRTVRLHMFGANVTVQIYEEIDGLPAGSAAWRHSATTDANGQIGALQVGRGRLWLRGGALGAPMLRELVMDEVAPLPRYKPNPSNALPVPFAALFRPLQPIPETGIEITNSYRHQRFTVLRGDDAKVGRMGRVTDSFDRAVARAQVFAIEPTGPRGIADSRFLGFSAADGSFLCGALAANAQLVVIGPDGCLGMLGDTATAGTLRVRLRNCGRVQLDESLRAAAGTNRPSVAVRFECGEAPLGGMRPSSVRFLSAATAWEAGDLPPGEYSATFESLVRTVTVPENGVAVLR